MENNRLVIGFKEEMFAKECNIININWLSDRAAGDILKSPLRAVTKIRYSHSGADSTLTIESSKNRQHQADNDHNFNRNCSIGEIAACSNGDYVKVIFDEPQLAVTPGQCAVFYDRDHVLGAGFIA